MEVIIAIFVIVTALVALMSLIGAAIASGNSASAKLVAANLAQEGVEIVKSVRELNYGVNGWDDWYANFTAGNYSIQYDSTDFGGLWDSFLQYDPASGLYRYGGGSDSIFKRKIILTKDNNNEIGVISEVTWRERGVAKSIRVEDKLWNWR